MTRVAIMQPTYLPWAGYFGLMHSVDLFIFLDSVQFSRRSWQQRNQIKTPAGAKWLTVPVQTKGRREQSIAEVEVDTSSGFAAAHRRTLELNYRNAPHYQPYAEILLPLLDAPSSKLADLTIGLTQSIARQLNIDTSTMRASTLNNSGSKADLLALLCEQVGATEYVSPPGSREYLEASDAFDKVGIPVRYFQFHHPEYPQLFGEFLPYMSCLDMLFNCGQQSQLLIEGGCEVSE